MVVGPDGVIPVEMADEPKIKQFVLKLDDTTTSTTVESDSDSDSDLDPLADKVDVLKKSGQKLKELEAAVPASEIEKAIGVNQWNHFTTGDRLSLVSHLSKLLRDETVTVSTSDLLKSMSVLGVSRLRNWLGWLPFCNSSSALRQRVVDQLSKAQESVSAQIKKDRQQLVVDLLEHLADAATKRKEDTKQIKALMKTILESTEKINGLTTRTNNAETQVSNLNGQVLNMNGQVSALTTRAATAEGQVTALNVLMNGLTTRATNAEGQVNALNVLVDGLTTRATNAEGQVIVLTTRAASAEGRVGQLERDLQLQTNALTTARVEIVSFEQKIATLEGRAGTAENQVILLSGSIDQLQQALTLSRQRADLAEVATEKLRSALALSLEREKLAHEMMVALQRDSAAQKDSLAKLTQLVQVQAQQLTEQGKQISDLLNLVAEKDKIIKQKDAAVTMLSIQLETLTVSQKQQILTLNVEQKKQMETAALTHTKQLAQKDELIKQLQNQLSKQLAPIDVKSTFSGTGTVVTAQKNIVPTEVTNLSMETFKSVAANGVVPTDSDDEFVNINSKNET